MRGELPKDPIILLSYVNTKLRDEYADLSAFCAAVDVEESALKEQLGAAGFCYDAEKNQFR